MVQGLKHNLISISQLCDDGKIVIFDAEKCSIMDKNSGEVKLTAKRCKNMYVVHLDDMADQGVCLLASKKNSVDLWHRSLGHASTSVIKKLLENNLVDGLPKIDLKMESVCKACSQGKQHRKSFKTVQDISTSRPLELIHMDLFGPISVSNLGGKNFGYVLVDDFSRFTWTFFLKHKNEAFEEFEKKFQEDSEVLQHEDLEDQE